jgi:hypothetical protein
MVIHKLDDGFKIILRAFAEKEKKGAVNAP